MGDVGRDVIRIWEDDGDVHGREVEPVLQDSVDGIVTYTGNTINTLAVLYAIGCGCTNTNV